MRKFFRVPATILLLISMLLINSSALEKSKIFEFNPVDIPDPGIPGFDYPTENERIDAWVYGGMKDSIYRHAWGLWTAINLKTSETYGGDTLRVWETWFSLDEVIEMVKEDMNMRDIHERVRPGLDIPSQILHFDHINLEHPDDTVFESVQYSPASADYAVDNKVFLESTLDSMLAIEENLGFPSAAMNIKPVFKIITDYNVDENGLYSFKTWTGPPEGDSVTYPQRDWSACVYVDTTNNAMGDGSVDYTCNTPTPQNTYNLDDFIYFRIDDSNAEYLKDQYDFKCDPGDFAILVAMHMTTAEIDRWTWESFWWTPDPENPAFPSLPAIVDQRPEQLQGAAAHYAMTVAYQMVEPAQPEYGGVSEGDVLYAYNPYLEAIFEDTALNNNNWDFAKVISPDGDTIVNKVGIRSNCMSCHAQANWGPGGEQTDRLGYIGNAYVDMAMSSPNWEGVIQADFSWSVVDNVIKNVTGIDSEEENVFGLKVYPNPASERVIVKVSGMIDFKEIQLYDIRGQLMKSAELGSIDSEFSLAVSDLKSGVYLLKAGRHAVKILVK